MKEVSEKVYIKHIPIANLHRFSNKEAKESIVDFNVYIGASLKGNDVLRGLNQEEEERYLKDIIGVNPKSQDWNKETKNYWANMRARVPQGDIGLELEIGFSYPSDEIAAKAEKAADDFTEYVDILKSNQKFGNPINVTNYILFRYALVYNKIANKEEDIYKSPNITMYITSKSEKLKKETKLLKAKQKAFAKSMEIGENETIIDGILYQFDIPPRHLSLTEKLLEVNKIVTEKPYDFIRIVNDSKFEMKSLIEGAIINGDLRRIENTDVIYFGDNDLLGNSIDETIVFLTSKEPRNTNILNTIKAKQKIKNKVVKE
jgi:hypothetical protein